MVVFFAHTSVTLKKTSSYLSISSDDSLVLRIFGTGFFAHWFSGFGCVLLWTGLHFHWPSRIYSVDLKEPVRLKLSNSIGVDITVIFVVFMDTASNDWLEITKFSCPFPSFTVRQFSCINRIAVRPNCHCSHCFTSSAFSKFWLGSEHNLVWSSFKRNKCGLFLPLPYKVVKTLLLRKEYAFVFA